MNSDYMKTVLMNHFRFKKGYGCLASEAGEYNSDILAVSKKNHLIEIEIKTSKADFNADFRKPKHQIYGKSDKFFVPTYFYFAVPENDKPLIEYASTKLLGKPYGLVLIKEKRTGFAYAESLSFLKKGKKLHDREVTEKERYYIIQRMGSELANAKRQLLDLKIQLNEKENSNDSSKKTTKKKTRRRKKKSKVN